MAHAELNGTRICYQRYGANGPPLVLLHGAYLDHGQWRPQIAELSERFHILAPDMRGHGRSGSCGQPFTVAQLAADIAALLRHLGLPPATVCGHSLGGMVAQQLALDHPGLVAALVLAETSYGTRATPLESLLTDIVTPLLLLAPVGLQAQLFARALGRRSPAARRYLAQAVAAYSADHRTYRAIWRAVVGFSSAGRLAELLVPTLVLAGAANRQTHAQAHGLARAIAGARLELLADAGHLLNWDAPEGFSAALLRFAGPGVGSADPTDG